MTDIREGALNPRVAPRRVLLRHPQDQPSDLGEHARTTAPPLRVRPLPRDQLPMPAENRVGRHERRDRREAATAQPVPVHGQPPAFFIGQAEPAAHVPAEDAVFCDEVGHRVLRPLVEPADQRRQEHPEGPRVEHGGRVYLTNSIPGPRLSNETLRGRRREGSAASNEDDCHGIVLERSGTTMPSSWRGTGTGLHENLTGVCHVSNPSPP